MRELLYQDKSAYCHLDFASTKGILCPTLPTGSLVISTVVSRYPLYCFEIKGSFCTNRCRVVLSSIHLKHVEYVFANV